jgi:integrase
MADKPFSTKHFEALTEPGYHPDNKEAGLILSVSSATSKSWVFRFRWADKGKSKGNDGNKRCEIGLGSFPKQLSLADARTMVQRMREDINKGIKPVSPRKAAKAEKITGTTFQECAETFIKQHVDADAWTNEKHQDQWSNTLTAYVYPIFGDTPIAIVDKAMVVKALDAIWTSKPETARRVRSRIKNIIDWAIDRGYRTAANPVPTPKGMGPQPDNSRNQPALPWAEVPAFMADLRSQEGVAGKALELAILCASRSGEVRLMQWSTNEIDLLQKRWTIPAERMKARREHVVPLTDRAVEIIQYMRDRAFNDFVFPGERRDAPLSDMTLTAVIRRMSDAREEQGLPRYIDPKQGNADVVPHGFRAAFKSWSSATQPFAREVSEASLAHVEPDKTVRAYDRDDLFIKRSKLMAAWERYCTKPAVNGKVTSITEGKRSGVRAG